MKAMLIGANERLTWSEVPEPVVGRGDILIAIRAAAVNRADILQRQGKYPSPAGAPPYMGLEVAGDIIGLGEDVVASGAWHLGDKVCALLGGGGYAERVAAPAEQVMPLPKGLTYEEAASLPEAYATCYLNIFGEGSYQDGETLYFPAGASGLASVGIPMAKAFGSYVITTVLGPEKKAAIAHLKADVVIDTLNEDLVSIIEREATAGHPIDVAVDCLAGVDLGRVLPYVHEGCRWVLISTLAGTETTLPLRAVLTRGITLKGSMLRKRSSAEKGNILRALVEKLWPKLEDKSIVPTIYKVLPISEAREAQAILERGESVGKVVLRVEG